MSSSSFKYFLDQFTDQLQKKSKQVNLATWILETTGSKDAALLKAALDTELKLLFNDKETFNRLLAWDEDKTIKDPLQKRALNVLIRSFKSQLIPKELLQKCAEKEAELALLYSNFRPQLNGKSLSENEIKEILTKENDVQKRKEVWEASKQIGKVLAPLILDLVELRNEMARSAGYSDYFTMQLDLQEVDAKKLFTLLEQLFEDSEAAYLQALTEINTQAQKRFQTNELGPWAWSEPFCQEDPLSAQDLDQLVEEVDIIETCQAFYKKMGLNVEPILQKSDNFERPGKNQHAFCMHIDREGDIRTLNNVRPSLKWLEVVLHELGHAVYELGLSKDISWLLREPPHMITTEAMALLAGRQAYMKASLDYLIGPEKEELKQRAEVSLKRRQLIFSRWVLVMTYFEKELYQNPHQDLNQLWWSLVQKYQKVESKGSESGCDWAAKYHIGLAPVYYFSYLLGELFASTLRVQFPTFYEEKTGQFLKEKLFHPANSLSWNELIEHVTEKPLSSNAWLKEFTCLS